MLAGTTKRHKLLVRALLTVASVLAVLAIFAVWAERQALDADNWADTSSQLLQDDAVRTQVAGFLVEEAYANVDVAAELRAGLPPRLEPLAGPAAAALRQVAERSTLALLGRPRVQELWEASNRLTMEQFIRLADGDSRAVTADGGAVVLDLRVVVLELVRRLGLPGRAASQLPEDAGAIRIMDGGQVGLLQDATSVLRSLAFVLPPLALGLFALAVFLARDRRRRVLMWVGVDLLLAGVVVLVARGLVGDAVVGSLASTQAVEPAVEATWSIATSMLRDVAQATIIGAIPLLACAWLAGPARPAVAIRRAMAPTLRERPGVAYGTVAALALLVVAWGPIPATQKLVPMLIAAALAALGLHVLRSQVAREFPDAGSEAARTGDGGPLPGAWRPARQPPPVSDPGSGGVRLDGLERLASLHDRGILTDAEFATEKTAMLDGGARG